jgi:Tol biopolymer transport system component
MLDLVTGVETVVVTGLDGVAGARFMPDGSLVMYAQFNGTWGIWRTTPEDDPTLLWKGIVSAPSPSNDGRRIVFGEMSRGLRILDLGNGTSSTYSPEQLGLAMSAGALSPSFSQNDDRIIFNWVDTDLADGPIPEYIAEVSLETGEVKILLTEHRGRNTHGAVFLPDGQHAVYALDGLYLLDIGLDVSFRLTGPDEVAFPRVSGAGRSIVYQVMGPPDASGRRLFGVSLFRLDTQQTVEVFASRQQIRPLPDIDFEGRTIVYAREHLAPPSQAAP